MVLATNLFIDLLQVSLGNKDALSKVPTEKHWEEMQDLAVVQTLTGVLLDGIERLPAEQRPTQDLLLEWIGETLIIEAQNKQQRQVFQKAYSCLEKGGVKVAFMKGLVCGARYPIPERRECGDIDFVVKDAFFSRTLDLLEEIGEVDQNLVHEHHGMVYVDDVLLEPHYKVHNFQNPRVDKAMKKLFGEVFPERLASVRIGDMDVPVFPSAFEGVILTGHMVNHVYADGLGLRQVVDFYYWIISNFVSNPGGTDFKDELWRGLRMLRMERAFRVFAYICEQYMGLSSKVLRLDYTEKEKRTANKLMEDIMAVGNFGRGECYLGDNHWLIPLRSYMWVLGRCWKLGSLCPAEARWWPVSKLRRFWLKKIGCRKML